MAVPHDIVPSAASLAAAARLAPHELVAQGDPEAAAFAFDPRTRRGCKPPPELATVFRFESPVAELSALVEPTHVPSIRAAWERTLTTGADRVRLPSYTEPGTDRWWILLDVRTTYNRILCIEGSRPVDETDGPIMPRVGRMQVGADGVILAADRTCGAMLGRHDLVGRSSLEFVHPDDHATGIGQWLQMLEQPGTSIRVEVRYQRADGSSFWVEITNHNRLHDLGYVEREILDVSARVGAEQQVSARDQVISGIARALPNGIAYFDPSGWLRFANERWHEITGAMAPATRASFLSVVTDPDPQTLETLARESLDRTGSFDHQISIEVAPQTPQRRCQLAVRKLSDDGGMLLGHVASLDDVTANWHLQQRLIDQATRDQLTGLPNRTAALEHLERELHTGRAAGTTTATIFIDINDLKPINDVLGHEAGDRLLQAVGRRLLDTIRPGDVVARHGGDEFVVICPDIGDQSRGIELARRALNAMAGSYRVGAETVDVTASCGVALDIGDMPTGERMIAEAHLAMCEQKRTGRHEPGLFAPELFEEQRKQLNRDSALASAASDGTLELFLQPIVQLDTRRTVGYEALLRWHFDGELVLPDQFIGQAERRGLITRIGAWVLDDVCRIARDASDPALQWTVNVSPLQMRDPSFPATVASTLARHGIDGAQLSLELTEGVLMAADRDTLATAHQLRKLGVSLVVDDFGTGYASLDYLRTFPVDGVKIDRTFTADIASPRTQLIVSSVMSMAETLDLSVVVEGIETAEQAALVASTGATRGQGYLFSRPRSWRCSTP